MLCHLCIKPGSLQKSTHSSRCLSALWPRRALIFNGSPCVTLHFSDLPCLISPRFYQLKLLFPTSFFPDYLFLRTQPAAAALCWGPVEGRGSVGKKAAASPNLISHKNVFRNEAVGMGLGPASRISANGLRDGRVEPCARMCWEF